MPDTIPGLDKERCLKRNRLAARRDNLNTGPVRLLRGGPEAPADARMIGTLGELPAHTGSEQATAEELALINALLPPNAKALTAADVYVHFAEAANGNFIPDRFMFLDGSTLRNIAGNAAEGVAFMNSHRTGGLSTPSELPFGKTFCGQYQRFSLPDGTAFERSVVGFYMLRSVCPNGSGGPTTDDLHRMIDGGTLFDVSVGLWPGSEVCDVCGNDLDGVDREGRYLCQHVPGTQRRMTEEQIAAQEARGVPKGMASFTLCDYHMGEVSGVYDGAVPGAGFRKALALCRRGELERETILEARTSYAVLLGKGDLPESPEELAALADRILTQISGEGSSLAGETFAQHSERVLATLDELIDRAEGYAALKAQDGRRASLARRSEWERLGTRLAALLSATADGPDGEDRAKRLRALRMKHLRLRAGATESTPAPGN